jgi:hypothetical protein
MKTKLILAALAAAILCFPAVVEAQSTGGDSTATPPASGRPSDGAIQGGAILPGETGGMPSGRGPVPPSDSAIQRCHDLVGTLREECLLKQRGASSGPTSAPRTEPRVDPRADPPPQNPR